MTHTMLTPLKPPLATTQSHGKVCSHNHNVLFKLCSDKTTATHSDIKSVLCVAQSYHSPLCQSMHLLSGNERQSHEMPAVQQITNQQ